MSNIPKVSVLMPVYNASSFLKESIDSILSQSFTDFEFLIINDGSTDPSANIIDSYTDYRIKHIKFPVNGGITKALNTGLELARGVYIVRMDADDIAFPYRIDKQVKFMDENPDVALSGTWVKYFGNREGIIKSATSNEDIVWAMLFGCPFFHPTVIIRSFLLKSKGLSYPANYQHAEDYALWSLLIGLCKFANLDEVLLQYRFFENSISATNKAHQQDMGVLLRRENHEKLLCRPLQDEEWQILNGESKSRINIQWIVDIYEEINRINNLFSHEQFRQKVRLRVKQLIYNRRIDGSSYKWLLKNLYYDFALIKYIKSSALAKV